LPTETPGHAGALARQAITAGADLVLVMGGDGTINETINGMVHSSVPLGVIPAGTANVLSMELGLGKRAERAIASIGSLVERRIALGRMCAAGTAPRYFLSMGGAGLDAKIVHDLNPRLKARTGKFAYWAAGFGQLTSSVTNITARVDGKGIRPCGFALASRVRNYGGDLEIARGASLLRDDFEVVLFEGTNPLRYAWYMLGVGIRRVQAMQGVHTYRARRVDFAGEGHVQIDGEYVGLLPATFEIEPAALTLLMPPDYG
jgi:diacylglycerol kinase (ATP)